VEKRTTSQKKAAIKREFSSGGAVFRKTQNGKIMWLMTKSSPSKEYPGTFWRLQKGWLDDKKGGKEPGPLATGKKKASDEDLKKAAIREVKEEGGAEAKIVKKIRTETYFYTNANHERIMKFVTFYLMQWLADTPEGPDFETSEVRWLPFAEARKLLTHSGEKKILDEAEALLNSAN